MYNSQAFYELKNNNEEIKMTGSTQFRETGRNQFQEPIDTQFREQSKFLAGNASNLDPIDTLRKGDFLAASLQIDYEIGRPLPERTKASAFGRAENFVRLLMLKSDREKDYRTYVLLSNIAVSTVEKMTLHNPFLNKDLKKRSDQVAEKLAVNMLHRAQVHEDNISFLGVKENIDRIVGIIEHMKRAGNTDQRTHDYAIAVQNWGRLSRWGRGLMDSPLARAQKEAIRINASMNAPGTGPA